MTSSEILQKLRVRGSEQTRKTYARHGITGDVYGVSFADLTKLKKQIKQNHLLATELWASGNADARNLALMIADPKVASKKQLEQWVGEVNNTMLASALAVFIQKTDYAHDFLILIDDQAEFRQIMGWGIVGAMALYDTACSEDFFEPYLVRIQTTLQTSKNFTKYAMNNALIAIGGRTLHLKAQAQQVARILGKVVVDHGQTACKTPDAYEYIEKMWARKKS